MTKTLSEEFIKKLLKQAEICMWTETKDPWGFNPADFSGGNYDDAYYGGQTDGETSLAREVLEELGIEYKIPEEE